MNRRNTLQCEIIFETVKNLHCHPTADMVYDEIKGKYPSISRGTVYRNLNKLCEMGKISKLVVPGEAERFDHLCKEHYHAKCLKCGKIVDMQGLSLPSADRIVVDSNGFNVTGCEVIFTGYCDDCMEN